MKLMTISEVSKNHDVSTRTLRYYEEIGLIQSKRKEDYAYRVYDEETVSRLQIILILRKMDINLKDIREIITSNNPDIFIGVLKKNLVEVEHEMTYLNDIKEVIHLFLDYVQSYQSLDYDIHKLSAFSDDTALMKLQPTSNNSRKLKEKMSMDQVKNKIGESKITNVRIIHIPPMTVASSYCPPCKEPEGIAMEKLTTFIHSTNLHEIKPDMRVIGFNNSNEDASGNHGYEFWVSIPEDMEVEKPMEKKFFSGGLYAAHSIKMGDFHEWRLFSEWMKASEEYAYDRREPLGMEGTLEETLNAYNQFKDNKGEIVQLDLLIPIKRI